MPPGILLPAFLLKLVANCDQLLAPGAVHWPRSARGKSAILTGRRGTQKGTGIAASPHVTGLRPIDPDGSHGLLSAACSARAGKGMRASRRSPRPNSRHFSRRIGASYPATSGPLQIRRKRRNWSLAECFSRLVLQPFHRLRGFRADDPLFVDFPSIARFAFAKPQFRVRPSRLLLHASPSLARRFGIRFHRASAVLRNLHCACAPLPSRDCPSLASLRPCPAGFPKAPVLAKSGKVMILLGFPLPDRLLTVMKLSSKPSRAKPEKTAHAC